MNHPASLHPITLEEPSRHQSIDTLRGVASLGILVMNIVAFGLPSDSYLSPVSAAAADYAGEFRGMNAAFWAIQHIFFDQKMMSIFSMLFGAGLVVLDSRRGSAAGVTTGFAAIYYRRVGFLLALGLIHAFIFWYGDILLSYAMCGLILYPMRRLSPTVQIVIASCLLVFGAILLAGMGGLMSLAPVPESGTPEWAPTPEKIDAEVAAFRGGWSENITQTAVLSLMMNIFMFVLWTFWRSLSMMLLGMALMKTGFFTASWSVAAYRKTALISMSIGLPLVLLSGWSAVRNNFNMATTFLVDMPLNHLGSVGMALGYCAIVMLLHKGGVFTALRNRLAAVGRIGLTSYLMQTLICTTIFYGRGLGLYGKFERGELIMFVLGVWAFLLIACPWWVARFRYGPFEWAWRSFTYLSIQPMRRQPVVAVNAQ